MTEPRPLVCVFLKLPPNHRLVSRIHEIACKEVLPQVDRLNRAFKAAQVAHPSSEAKKIWKEARKTAAKRLLTLREVAFDNYAVAVAFTGFLSALSRERNISETYKELLYDTCQAVEDAGIAQAAIIQFREDFRIAINQVTILMNDDAKETSSFTAESNQSILKIATAVEECGALLEEFSDEFTEVKQQGSPDNDNHPSDEEFRMVQEKWLAFQEIAEPLRLGWENLMDHVRGHLEGYEPPMTPPNEPTGPTMPSSPSKNQRLPFWRKFLRIVLPCFSSETIA